MIYDYSIVGLHIRCHVPFELHITTESLPFMLMSADSDVDISVSIEIVDRIDCEYANPNNYDVFTFADNHSWDVYHKVNPSDCYYAHVSWNNQSPHLLTCRIVSEYTHLLSTTQNLLNLISMESILLRMDSLLLHSSLIEFNGKCILFSASSGTGKSTQASLWEKHRNAEIINGDRAALRNVDGCWTAWGLPYAGTSGIYRNESAPVKTIVALRQSKENTIRRLSPSEAMRYLYPELTIHRWEPSSVDSAIDLLTDLVMSVPVFLLECRPDEEAVLVLEQALKEVLE